MTTPVTPSEAVIKRLLRCFYGTPYTRVAGQERSRRSPMASDSLKARAEAKRARRRERNLGIVASGGVKPMDRDAG